MLTIAVPHWMIAVAVVMWCVSTALKIMILRLERRAAQGRKAAP